MFLQYDQYCPHVTLQCIEGGVSQYEVCPYLARKYSEKQASTPFKNHQSNNKNTLSLVVYDDYGGGGGYDDDDKEGCISRF